MATLNGRNLAKFWRKRNHSGSYSVYLSWANISVWIEESGPLFKNFLFVEYNYTDFDNAVIFKESGSFRINYYILLQGSSIRIDFRNL